jgi:hypothetical protein
MAIDRQLPIFPTCDSGPDPGQDLVFDQTGNASGSLAHQPGEVGSQMKDSIGAGDQTVERVEAEGCQRKFGLGRAA